MLATQSREDRITALYVQIARYRKLVVNNCVGLIMEEVGACMPAYAVGYTQTHLHSNSSRMK